MKNECAVMESTGRLVVAFIEGHAKLPRRATSAQSIEQVYLIEEAGFVIESG